MSRSHHKRIDDSACLAGVTPGLKYALCVDGRRCRTLIASANRFGAIQSKASGRRRPRFYRRAKAGWILVRARRAVEVVKTEATEP